MEAVHLKTQKTTCNWQPLLIARPPRPPYMSNNEDKSAVGTGTLLPRGEWENRLEFA